MTLVFTASGVIWCVVWVCSNDISVITSKAIPTIPIPIPIPIPVVQSFCSPDGTHKFYHTVSHAFSMPTKQISSNYTTNKTSPSVAANLNMVHILTCTSICRKIRNHTICCCLLTSAIKMRLSLLRQEGGSEGRSVRPRRVNGPWTPS
ncbi:hypothetical protein BD769DRAFT_67012 [Suillus cothurnatus]|nr:hypothetical protein BD769DRAFT_67012 [Suillus cothurnatus]